MDNDKTNDPMPTSTTTMMIHSCEIQVTFPTNLQAKQAMEVLQVDPEPTNRVTKQFRLITDDNNGNNEISQDDTTKIVSMVVRFESKELKMLRVAISSFMDYLTVVLKTMQEFDTTMMTENE